MALRDTWHRSLVYFGLAEDQYVDDEYYEPETGTEEAYEGEDFDAEPAPRRTSRSSARRSDEIDDIFGDDDMPPARARSRPRASDGGGGVQTLDTGSDVQVHMVTPRNFNDAQQVADEFKRTKPVIINLQSADAELAKRVIDFASGMTYALGGGMQRIADKVFLLTPRGVHVSSDEKARILEQGFFSQS